MNNEPFKFVKIIASENSTRKKPRLFCFHPGGSSAQIFYGWIEALQTLVDIYAIELPGRDESIDIAPYTDIKQFIKPLVMELENYNDRPMIFFGYCMGGLIAFEVTRMMGNIILHLFLAASAEPIYAADNKLNRFMSDEELKIFLSKQFSLKLTNEINEEYINLLLPTLKADRSITFNYQYKHSDPLTVPLTIYGGLQDDAITLAALHAWQCHTSANFRLHMFPGDHMFINAHTSLLLKKLTEDISSIGF